MVRETTDLTAQLDPAQTELTARQALQAALENQQAGRLPQAEAAYRQALELKPDYAEAHNNLGNVLHALGRTEEAERHYRRAAELRPDSGLVHANLGKALATLDRAEEAERCIRKALELQPDYAEAHNDLGKLLQQRGLYDEAKRSYRRATELNPELAAAHFNLGNILGIQNRITDAESSYRQALALSPDSAEGYNGLGKILAVLRRIDEAEECYRKALALKPDYPEADENLGLALAFTGRFKEAERYYRHALAIQPDRTSVWSSLLLTLNYIHDASPDDIYAEHVAYGTSLPRAEIQPHANSRDGERRLRIGYVSADLRDHSVAFFIEPILARHEHTGFEIFCFASHARDDAVTRRLRSFADHWDDVSALGDEGLATLVRAHAIDILIDLNGHSPGNRLGSFRMKPAPVQVTYLGYPGTTGLVEMDYRISDAVLDPALDKSQRFTEQPVRLPGSMWCYRPRAELPAVVSPPCQNTGHVSFGSFNDSPKINPQIANLWGRLLHRIPGSRIIFTNIPRGAARERLLNEFQEAGVSSARIDIHDRLPRAQFDQLFSHIDIALDPFPYAGTTTTCDVLWMGVPVVTLCGESMVSRSGASLLHAVALDELVAHIPEAYLDIAAALARDPRRLAALRAGMRKRMAASPLMDEIRFTRDLESAYRTMWRTWCGKQRT